MADPVTRQIPWLRVFVEGVVIVGSILLAFGLQAWWEGRQERIEEGLVLRGLVQALEIDLDELGSRHQIQAEVHQNLQALLDHFESEAPYSDELEPYFGAVHRWVGVRTNSAPYEALKNRGLGLISDDSLRFRLIYYYENQFPSLLSASLHEQTFVKETATPYFLSNFRMVELSTWIPRDYAAVQADPYFRNVCMTKLARLENRILPYYEASLEMIRGLLHDIDNQLVE